MENEKTTTIEKGKTITMKITRISLKGGWGYIYKTEL